MTHTTIRSNSIAYVVPDSGGANALRTDAGKDQQEIGRIPEGRPVQILNDVKQTDGRDRYGTVYKVNWWEVRALCRDGIVHEGYTAERADTDQQKYYLQAYADPCGRLLISRLVHDETAKVVSDYVYVRPQPGVGSAAVGKKLHGETFKVYGYPQCDDTGRIWWSLERNQETSKLWICEVDKDNARYLDLA